MCDLAWMNYHNISDTWRREFALGRQGLSRIEPLLGHSPDRAWNARARESTGNFDKISSCATAVLRKQRRSFSRFRQVNVVDQVWSIFATRAPLLRPDVARSSAGRGRKLPLIKAHIQCFFRRNLRGKHRTWEFSVVLNLENVSLSVRKKRRLWTTVPRPLFNAATLWAPYALYSSTMNQSITQSPDTLDIEWPSVKGLPIYYC